MRYYLGQKKRLHQLAQPEGRKSFDFRKVSVCEETKTAPVAAGTGETKLVIDMIRIINGYKRSKNIQKRIHTHIKHANTLIKHIKTHVNAYNTHENACKCKYKLD